MLIERNSIVKQEEVMLSILNRNEET